MKKRVRGGEAAIRRAKEAHELDLMALDGVVGVGVGEAAGRPVIKVYVAGLTAALRQAIPRSLDGFDVDVEATGDLHALGTDPAS